MGYYVTLDNSDVVIPTDKIDAAFGAVYDETCKNLAEVLDMNGFWFGETDEGLSVVGYDSKSGDEEVFFKALAPFIEDGGMMEWTGEDGYKWAWKFSGGEMLVGEGKVIYDFG